MFPQCSQTLLFPVVCNKHSEMAATIPPTNLPASVVTAPGGPPHNNDNGNISRSEHV
jgi:hypothetical protein